MSEEERKLLVAIEKNEISDYIRGTKGYLTIPDDVIKGGYPIYEEGKDNYFSYIIGRGFVKVAQYDKSIGKKLIDALKNLLRTDDMYDFYCCSTMLFRLIRGDYCEKINIQNEDLKELQSLYKINLLNRNEQLQKEQCVGSEISMYDYVHNMNESLNEKKMNI